VSDGQEACDLIEKNFYHLFILDIKVPGVNGHEVIKYIRSLNPNAPIMITTSLVDIDDMAIGYELGCNEYLKKPFELAELKGKRLVIASEMAEGMRLNTAVVKQITSTDEIQAEKKYKDPFHFVPSHTLVLYTNHLPKVGANDDGTWRRLVVIPFNAKITGRSDIKNFADHLYDNAAPAIMSWIIEGAEKAIKANFKTNVPTAVSSSVKAYREANDWLGHFLGDCCQVGDQLSEKSGELYSQYRAYCAKNMEYTRSTTDFYSALEQAGFKRKRTSKGNHILGLKLVEDGYDFLD